MRYDIYIYIYIYVVRQLRVKSKSIVMPFVEGLIRPVEDVREMLYSL